MKTTNTPDILELLGKMYVHVDKNLTVLNVNSHTCLALGYESGEIIGENWFEKFAPNWSFDDSSQLSKTAVSFYDKPILTKLGESRMIAWHKTEIYDEEGNLESAICIGDDISKQEDYLHTLHKISSLLLENTIDVPYAEFARLVGEAANADHTYIFENKIGTDGGIRSVKVSEWGKGRFIENSENLPGLNNIKVEQFAKEWGSSMKSGNTINLKASSFPSYEQQFFKEMNIQAILLIPIIVNKEFYGFIGFDNRINEREWTKSEIEFLKASVKNLEQRIVRSKILRSIELENAKFQATMDAIESIVIVSNFTTGEVFYINKVGEEAFGNVIGEKIGDALNLTVPLPERYCQNKLLLSSNGIANEPTEWILENPDTKKFYNSKVKAIKWTSNEWVRLETINDISEKQKAKVSLLESESKFRKLSALTIEGILIHDRGIILDANQALSNILQYEYNELIGVNIIDLVVLPEYHQTIFENLKKKSPEPYEVYAKKKDGTIIPTEIEAKSINYNGEILRVVAIRDITDRKKAEAELIRQKNKAEESNRLKTQFLNNMSHEIRTPLNGIVGFTQFLNDPELSNEKKSHFINIIQSSSTQLVRIIDDIIEISKLETKQVKPRNEEVSINSMLLELFSIFELKAKEKNISLHLNKGLTDEASVITTDKTKLLKVLNNLVENALKFTSHGSVEIGYVQEGDSLKIWIKDSGIGVPEEKQKVIFERFSQADSETSAIYGGLGLGLSIAKENTQLLGGVITIDSEPNQGATFHVIIPYNPVNLMKKETMKENKNKYHVLIAEDEEVNFIFLEFLLQSFKKDIKITNVRNGEEAVSYCMDNQDVNMVFMDMKMPLMNGFDATYNIRKLNSDLPIIAITAYSGYADEKRALDVGCNDFLTKPIDAEVFRSVCEKNLFQN